MSPNSITSVICDHVKTKTADCADHEERAGETFR